MICRPFLKISLELLVYLKRYCLFKLPGHFARLHTWNQCTEFISKGE